MTDADMPSDSGPATKDATKPTAGQELVEIVKTVFYALLIALVLRVFLFQPFTIPSASMEPNLFQGDYIIVTKWSYGYSRHSIPFSPKLFDGRILASQPKRGDIIVFKWPGDNRKDYIKRLIGLPGDKVQVRNSIVYVNDQPITRAVLNSTDPADDGRLRYRETMPGGKTYLTYDEGYRPGADDTAVFEVPQGQYFFMGDNRDNSADSRFSLDEGGVGFVPAENLVGKAQIILLSWDADAKLLKPWTWFLNARPSRFFNVLH